MTSLLKTICSMLKSPRAEQQMAAAVVLAETAPKDPAVVKALHSALSVAARPVRLPILDALGRIGSPRSIATLLPMMEDPDDEIRDRAAHALIGVGPAAIKPITKQILDAQPAARRALMAVLSRVKSADSVKTLVSLLGSGHPEASREAAQALLSLSREMTKAEVARLRSRVEAILEMHPEKAPEGALSAALMILGTLGGPGSLTRILKLTRPQYPEVVRRDALLCVSGILKGGAIPAKILAVLLEIIQDGPSPVLRSAALEVLGTVELPPSALASIMKLLENRDPAVRRFAARKLGGSELGGLKSARRLVALLDDRDPSLRDAVSESLKRLPVAAPLLVEALLECDSVHRGWGLAHILKRHVARLRKPVVKKIFERALRSLTADDRMWEPLLYVVRHHDPKLMYDWLMDASARFKKARKYAESEACLKPLTRGDHFDSEARYALALAGLRAARSRKSSPVTSGNAMDLVRQLVRDPDFPLVDRLKKERSHIKTEDLYFLGFTLSEGSAEEKLIGGELLRIVAARAGSSKLGKSARSKLRSQGLA